MQALSTARYEGRSHVKVEARLKELGLVLPEEQKLPGGPFPFVPVRIVGNRAVIAGHGPLNDDGSVWDVRGKVGGELTLEQGKEAAKLVGLAILADLKRAIGDLDRVTMWVQGVGHGELRAGLREPAGRD